jgi:predicted nuclease of predicted toxin-antitoxin system
MARLYADEQFPFEVVENLIGLGHDVLTVQAAGNANLKIPDEQVLDFATSNDRVVCHTSMNILSIDTAFNQQRS